LPDESLLGLFMTETTMEGAYDRSSGSSFEPIPFLGRIAYGRSAMYRREFLRTTGLTLGAIGIAGCLTQDGDSGQSPKRSPTERDPLTIAMKTEGSEYYFDPIGLFVKPGKTVTWTLKSGAHSTTAYKKGNGPAMVTRIPADATAWNSEIMSEQGATFEHTFDVTGTYDYFCIPHKSLGMVGRLVGGEPGGPAEGSMPPDGQVPKSSAIVEQGAIPHDEFTG
jgi:plastocyanin